MKKSTMTWLLLSVVVLLSLTATAVSQSPSKPSVNPVGEIISSGGSVSINGTPVTRGSTVFNGNEIQTGATTAFLNFLSGGGVLSIAPESRVKVSREQAKIVAEVMKGTVTVRSPLAATVIAPGRTVSSDPDNLFTVKVAEGNTSIEALMKPVSVTANGVVTTIAAQVGQAALQSIGGGGAKPRQVDQVPFTNRGRLCFITARCHGSEIGFPLPANTIRVEGTVTCGCATCPVPNTDVQLRLIFLNRTFAGPFLTTTNPPGPNAGRYQFIVTHANIPVGGVAQVLVVGDCATCESNVGNRCRF